MTRVTVVLALLKTLTAQWPQVPSKDLNLKPFTCIGDDSIWGKHSRFLFQILTICNCILVLSVRRCFKNIRKSYEFVIPWKVSTWHERIRHFMPLFIPNPRLHAPHGPTTLSANLNLDPTNAYTCSSLQLFLWQLQNDYFCYSYTSLIWFHC